MREREREREEREQEGLMAMQDVHMWRYEAVCVLLHTQHAPHLSDDVKSALCEVERKGKRE